MSKMAELYLDIETMLEKGNHPATISAVLDVPVVFVYDVIESLESKSEELSPFETINS
jgi:sugar-specific transcriptional regulator TrmB